MGRRKKKKKIKKKILMGVTVGGPAPGIRFQVDFNAAAHVVLLPTDPHYCAAIYSYVAQVSAINEVIAKFSHCVKR